MTAAMRPTPAGSEPAPPFLVSVDDAAGRIDVHGDLDRQHVQDFLDAVGSLEQSVAPCRTVDVSDLTFCDAGGLRGLLSAQRSAERSGRAFRVAGAGPWMRQLLRMIGCTAVEPPVD